MEYKYRMLNPMPFSTESIDFKLSETHLQNCLLVSPTKQRESLTYTVSMETIQDQDYSPFKMPYNQLLHVHEFWPAGSDQRSERKLNETYSLDTGKPIVSIKIQSDQTQQAENKSIQNQTCKGNLRDNKTQNVSMKKLQVKVKNVSLQPIAEERDNKFCKMGKVMKRIHSNIKTAKPRTASRKTLPSPSHQNTGQKLKQACTKQEGSFNQIKENSDNVQSVLNQGLKGSILNKTNSSSNANCSPELIRRKSDYVSSRKANHTKNSIIYLTDRPNQATLNYKSIRNRPVRGKIYSTLVQSENYQTCCRENKNYDGKSVLSRKYRSRCKSGKDAEIQKRENTKFSKQQNLSDSLSISAIRLSATDRSSQHLAAKILNIRKLSKDPQIRNDKQKINSQQKAKESTILCNIDINKDVLANGLHNRKGWRKVKEILPSKLFCF